MGHVLFIILAAVVGFIIYAFTGSKEAATAVGGAVFVAAEANHICVKLTGKPLWKYGWEKLNKVLQDSYIKIRHWLDTNQSFGAKAILVVVDKMEEVRHGINVKFIGVNGEKRETLITEEELTPEQLEELGLKPDESLSLDVDELKN